jgi:hypothetical protein
MIIYLKALNKKESKLDKVPLILFNILTSCANRRPQQSTPSAIKLFSFTIEINYDNNGRQNWLQKIDILL